MENLPTTIKTRGEVANIESARAIQEVQASMIIAKKFPRDQMEAYTRIMKACERPSLAKDAMYAYPRGGQLITGPSIRLAEVLAQNWGNLNFGIRELSQENGWSEVEAFAWDIETNTKQIKTFKVPHIRYTKKGTKNLTDPRDIYEHVANQGARRLRACILGVIPGDITEAAIQKCEQTLQGGDGKPIEDKIRGMLVKFKEIGVTKEMIEERIRHKVDTLIMPELIQLGKIYSSIRDGMAKRENFFNLGSQETEVDEKLTEKIKSGKVEARKDLYSTTEPETENQAPDPIPTKTYDTVNEALIASFNNLREPGLRAFEQHHRDEITNWPEKARKAFAEKWKRVIGTDYLKDIEPKEEPTKEEASNGMIWIPSCHKLRNQGKRPKAYCDDRCPEKCDVYRETVGEKPTEEKQEESSGGGLGMVKCPTDGEPKTLAECKATCELFKNKECLERFPEEG